MKSSGTLLVCRYLGDAALAVVDVTDIVSVISMPPLPSTAEELANAEGHEALRDHFYIVEKLGLDVMHIGGADENDYEGLQ